MTTIYTASYDSPLGLIHLAGDEQGLIGLWFKGQKYDQDLPPGFVLTANDRLEAFRQANRWLDIYFSGREPDFTPALSMIGTDFQLEVWRALLGIPYGQLASYRKIACRVGNPGALRATAHAISRNRISIIIPCHRVVSSNSKLTGYAGGIERKRALLRLEHSLDLIDD